MTQRYRDVLDYEIGARIVVEFTADRRTIVDYAVILTVDDEGSDARSAYTTVRTGSTTCTGTIGAARRQPRRRFMPVPLGKGREPRSSRFAPTTRR
jgi:hypothetical protein